MDLNAPLGVKRHYATFAVQCAVCVCVCWLYTLYALYKYSSIWTTHTSTCAAYDWHNNRSVNCIGRVILSPFSGHCSLALALFLCSIASLSPKRTATTRHACPEHSGNFGEIIKRPTTTIQDRSRVDPRQRTGHNTLLCDTFVHSNILCYYADGDRYAIIKL